MPASEAQILANQANAKLSTGPKSEAGKERSRRNSLKHGMTGGGVVLPEEAVRIAMFDPSKEATLARQYEASAERGFYRALKQLRQMELQAEAIIKADDQANDTAEHNAMMASFFESRKASQEIEDEYADIYAKLNIPLPRGPLKSTHPASVDRLVDVPMTIGRPR
jgi:hypothetical protein